MKNRIKEFIKERGITQKELASMIGMSEVGMSNAINGSATRATIEKVANTLNVNFDELIVSNTLFAKYGSDKTPLKFGNVEIPCYVLNNGLRVLSGRGIQKAIGAGSNTSGLWLQKFVNSEAIKNNLMPGVYEKFSSPISFVRNNAGGSQSDTYGYEATVLVDLCTAIIDAFNTRQYNIDERYFNSANIILRSVAKVGIIALVDEATGYNKEKTRAKNELQRFLAEFINKEASAWIKIFDDTFFEDVYKMRNWTWEKAVKKPSFVGKIINDIVYERIAPLVLQELKERNPKNESGNRRYRFHQFLTSEVGRPALKQHLAILHSFAIASDYNWSRFMLLLDKAHPKQYQQLALFDDYDIG